jgi:hypothetical protein
VVDFDEPIFEPWSWERSAVFDFLTLLRKEGVEESGSVLDRNMEGIKEALKDLLDVMMGNSPDCACR